MGEIGVFALTESARSTPIVVDSLVLYYNEGYGLFRRDRQLAALRRDRVFGQYGS